MGASFRRIRTATEPSEAAARRWARRAMTAPPPRAAGGRVWAIAMAAAILAGGGAVAARVALRAAVTNAKAPAAPPSDPSPATRDAAARRIAAGAGAAARACWPDPELGTAPSQRAATRAAGNAEGRARRAAGAGYEPAAPRPLRRRWTTSRGWWRARFATCAAKATPPPRSPRSTSAIGVSAPARWRARRPWRAPRRCCCSGGRPTRCRSCSRCATRPPG